jgi:hypothetical protein
MNVLEYGKAFYKIKRYDILHSFKKKPLHFDTQVEAVAKTLRETGYVLLEGYFSEEQCEMTRQEIDKILIDKKDFVQTDKHDSDHRLLVQIMLQNSLMTYFGQMIFWLAFGTVSMNTTILSVLQWQPEWTHE